MKQTEIRWRIEGTHEWFRKKKKFSSYNYVNVVSTQCKQFNGLKIISMNKKLKKKKHVRWTYLANKIHSLHILSQSLRISCNNLK